MTRFYSQCYSPVASLRPRFYLALPAQYNYYGVYDDELVKTAEGWRISTRRQYPLITTGEVAPDPQ